MSDVTAAVEQDAIADSLLGDPQTEQAETEPNAGTEAVADNQETETLQEDTEQQAAEEIDDDWLPTEQEKVFPDDVLVKYAQRYNRDEQWLADPLNRQLLMDKLNSDIYLRQQQSPEQEELQVEQAEELTQPQSPTFDEHMAQLKQIGEKYTDPRMAQAFANEFLTAFGVKEQATPEMAQALTRTMTTFGLNLVRTALSQELAPLLDNVMPGFSGMYYQSARASSWDTIRNSSPAFSGLPAYGSKEFVDLCTKLDNEYPALTEMGKALERANGGQLYGPAADKFYSTVAKLAVKQNVDPVLLAQAAQAGARNARRGEVRRSAGNLGAGKPNGSGGNQGSSKFQTNQDIFGDDTMEIWKREHGRV